MHIDRILIFTSIIIFLFGFISVHQSVAQSESVAIDEMYLAFQKFNYVDAKQAGQRALQAWQKLTPTNLIEVHKILAIIAYSEGDFFTAKAQFEQALSLRPDLALDSLYVSPKIQHFLNEVKTSLIQSNGPQKLSRHYLMIPDSRSKAALRSLVFPGLGQIYKNERKKARFIIVAAGVGIAATTALQIRRNSARKNYLAARSISKAQTTYKRFNDLNRVRNFSALATSAVWIYSFFDALIGLPAQPTPIFSHTPTLANDDIAIGLSWQIHIPRF